MGGTAYGWFSLDARLLGLVHGAYLWNAGYWGPQVGFYGGINYGFGYVGTGYYGGRWTNGHFFYNTRVNNVNVHVVRNVYQKTVIVHNSHVSFNGGRGGVAARPTAAQERFAQEHHTAPTEVQERHVSEARSDRNQFANVNHGRPSVVATAKPGEFRGPGVVQAKASASDRIGSSRTEGKTRTEPKTEAKPRTEPKSEATREPRTEAKPKTESKPATTREPKTEPKPATNREPKTEAKPKTEPKRRLVNPRPKPNLGPKQSPRQRASPRRKPNQKPNRRRNRNPRIRMNRSPKPSRD